MNPACARCGGSGGSLKFKRQGRAAFLKELRGIARPAAGPQPCNVAAEPQASRSPGPPVPAPESPRTTARCWKCGAFVGVKKMARHQSERCPALRRRASDTPVGPVNIGPPKTGGAVTRSKAKERFSQEELQERFENSFRQGGLCDGR